MAKFRLEDRDKLQRMLEERNLWLRMHSGKLLEVIQAEAQAKMTPDGKSYIISFYDEHLQYVCTIHKVVTKAGKTIHEHIEDASIDGIRYKAR